MKATTLIGLATAVVVTACSAPFSIRTDVSPTADFSKYQTIYVKSGNSSGNPVMDERIVEDVADAFQAKGYERVAGDTADTVAVVNTATEERRTYSAFYDGWYGWGWGYGWYGYGWGPPVIAEYTFTVGTVIVDVFDGSTKRAVWHGKATDVTLGDPEHDARKMREAIAKLVERYPARRAAATH